MKDLVTIETGLLVEIGIIPEMGPESQGHTMTKGLIMIEVEIDPTPIKDPGIINQMRIIKVILTVIIHVLGLIKSPNGLPRLVTPVLIATRLLEN